jgi:hypothetical protein
MFIGLNRVLFLTDEEFKQQQAERTAGKPGPKPTGTTASAAVNQR